MFVEFAVVEGKTCWHDLYFLLYHTADEQATPEDPRDKAYHNLAQWENY